MISLEHLPQNTPFGIRCPTMDCAEVLVEYIKNYYPNKYNNKIDMVNIWSINRENTIYYLHFDEPRCMNYGKVGGSASYRQKIYEFSDILIAPELPIERSDMDIYSMLGL